MGASPESGSPEGTGPTPKNKKIPEIHPSLGKSPERLKGEKRTRIVDGAGHADRREEDKKNHTGGESKRMQGRAPAEE